MAQGIKITKPWSFGSCKCYARPSWELLWPWQRW